jgi:hypothetical protein
MNQSKITASMLDPEDRDITYLRNAGNHFAVCINQNLNITFTVIYF